MAQRAAGWRPLLLNVPHVAIADCFLRISPVPGLPAEKFT
jgi:hypothetical protein